jgi:hypothetical protein
VALAGPASPGLPASPEEPLPEELLPLEDEPLAPEELPEDEPPAPPVPGLPLALEPVTLPLALPVGAMSPEPFPEEAAEPPLVEHASPNATTARTSPTSPEPLSFIKSPQEHTSTGLALSRYLSVVYAGRKNHSAKPALYCGQKNRQGHTQNRSFAFETTRRLTAVIVVPENVQRSEGGDS